MMMWIYYAFLYHLQVYLEQAFHNPIDQSQVTKPLIDRWMLKICRLFNLRHELNLVGLSTYGIDIQPSFHKKHGS